MCASVSVCQCVCACVSVCVCVCVRARARASPLHNGMACQTRTKREEAALSSPLPLVNGGPEIERQRGNPS